MAFIGDCRTQVRVDNYGGSECIFKLKETLKAVGWTVPFSSDGTTYDATGADVIDSELDVAGGLQNARAWFVVQQPPGGPNSHAGSRQWIFQHGNISGGAAESSTWRIAYSRSGGFSGGNATETATAPDERFLWGGGTPSAPDFTGMVGNLFPGLYSSPNNLLTLRVGDAAENWSWVFVLNNVGVGAQDTVLLFDGITDTPEGGGDRFVVLVGNSAWSGGTDWQVTNQDTNLKMTWFDDADDADDHYFTQVGDQEGIGFVNVSSENVHDGKDVTRLVTWNTSISQSNKLNLPLGGFKGVSKVIRFCGTTRDNESTYSIASPTARDWYIVNGIFAIPWNGSVAGTNYEAADLTVPIPEELEEQGSGSVIHLSFNRGQGIP